MGGGAGCEKMNRGERGYSGKREESKEGQGIGGKIQDRSSVTGILVILLTPSIPIHPLR